MPPPNTPTPNHIKSSSTSNAKSPSPSRNMAAPGRATPDPLARTRSTKGSTGSPLSARGSVRRPGQAPRSESSGGAEETKAETNALVDDLKEQLRKAENTSEEYQKQAAVLQSRLDEALADHDRFQETVQDHQSRLDLLERERQDGAKRFRDLQTAFESEKVGNMKAQEEGMIREQELTDTIQRLKDTISHKEKRSSMDGESLLSRAASKRGRSSPHPAGNESPDMAPRDSSQNNSKLIHQKDKIIESLRLELAEAQIKNVELENAGGGKTQELEKKLLEARVNNAKLLEENESYQVLLQERTLNGSFGKSELLDPHDSRSEQAPPTPHTPSLKPVSGSLADELEADDATDDNVDDKYRKMEADLNAQKDQNKALTLYVNKIITKLLQNETFEQLFEDGPLKSPAVIPEEAPASPPQRAEDINLESARKEAAEQAAGSSFLQRAGSIFGGRRARPKSLQPPQPTTTSPEPKLRTPTAVPMPMSPPQPEHQPQSLGTHLSIPNENPDSAPSIPLRRSASGRGHARIPSMRASHRRTTSDWSGAASVVNNMQRTPSGNSVLTTSAGLASPRQTSGSFLGNQPQPPPLILEDSERGPEVDGAGRGDVASDSGYGESVMSKATTDEPSSPRAAAAAALEGKPLPQPPGLHRSDTSQSNENKQGPTGAGSSWFSGQPKKEEKGGMRPLRLVQEKNEADAERKKANRTSFMGWFQKGQQPAGGNAPGSSPPPQPGMLGSPPPTGPFGHARSVSSVSAMGGAGPGPGFERMEEERPGSQH